MDQQSLVIRKILGVEYNITPVNYGTTWESIELEDGIEKPPKDEFNEKVSNFSNFINILTLRKRRNTLLDQSDKYMTIDFPHATPRLVRSGLSTAKPLGISPQRQKIQ